MVNSRLSPRQVASWPARSRPCSFYEVHSKTQAQSTNVAKPQARPTAPHPTAAGSA